jgi:DNA modification methylase
MAEPPMNREPFRLPAGSDHNQRIQVEYRSLTDLKLTSNNPRRHSRKQIQQLTNSVKLFGFVVPVLTDENGTVIAGQARVQAAMKLGLQEVPTIRLSHLSDAQVKAFMIADNRLAELSEWDDALLARQLKELSILELDFDLDVIGFDIGEIDLRIESLNSADEEEALDGISGASGPATSSLGDLWIMGRHRILCANALDPTSYDRLMQGQRASCVFTDPPYNVPVAGHVSGLGSDTHREFPMASGEMTTAEFQEFLRKCFEQYARNSTEGSLHYIFMDWRHAGEVLFAGGQVYNKLLNLCVWAKNNAGMGSMYRSQHELVFVFKKGSGSHRNNVELGRHGRYRTNVWSYPGMNSFGRTTDEGNMLALHPTVKPVRLVADAILDCTARGEIVLDSFLGSGTTLMAAEKIGRSCFGIELDPLYVDTVVRRWQAYTGDNARLAATGKTFEETSLDRQVSHVG